MKIRAIYLLCILAAAALPAWAQPSRAVLTFTPQAIESWQSAPAEIPLKGAEPFIAVSFVWDGQAESLEARFSDDGQKWEAWEKLGPDPHADQQAKRRISTLYFAEAGRQFLQLRASGPPEQVEAHFYSPGKTEAGIRTDNPAVSGRDPQFCPCPQPEALSRNEWCPSGTCPEDATPVNTSVTHLIVHHSAGPNNATDWAAVVRSFWDFHVNVNGWDDIGYNYLVDPDGVIYVGRGNNRLGAHFCGTNGGTLGTCVIGDFTNITPTDEALNGLKELLAWKACDIDVSPFGSAFHSSSNLTLDNISGHRDGCSTQCPGNAFYPMLPAVRQSVAEFISTSCSNIAPPDKLEATAMGASEILLEWKDLSDNETAFLIERAPSFNGPYVQIASVGADTTAYTDTGLAPETGYYYQLKAANEDDTSAYSNRAFAFTDAVVGIEGPLGAANVRVFPNPSKGQFILSLDSELQGAIQLRLLDATSREIWQAEMEGGKWTKVIPATGLPQGLYTLQLVHGQSAAAYKLIKE